MCEETRIQTAGGIANGSIAFRSAAAVSAQVRRVGIPSTLRSWLVGRSWLCFGIGSIQNSGLIGSRFLQI